MTGLTRKDLDEVLAKQRNDIEQLFDAKLTPVVENIKGLQKTVYGRMGSNGLAGAVKVLKWGYALLTMGLGVLIHKIFIL